MTDPQRNRIVAAFDRELADTPVPPELRSQTVRAAVARRRQPRHPRQQWALALVATVIAFAIVATIVLGTRGVKTVPGKSGPPPSPRSSASVTFDEARGHMVLFGGGNQANSFLDETWTFDGKGWTQHRSPVTPPGRQSAAMAYDAARQRVVLVGGMTNATTGKGQIYTGDTWTWDGKTWRQEHPINVPRTSQLVLGYDPISRMLIGLYVDPVPGGQQHTMGWNGTDWQELHPANQPGKSGMGTLVSDTNRLLYITPPFGFEGGRYFSQTFAWDGRDWHRLTSRVNLPGGVSTAVFDLSNRQVVALQNSETWTWDGVSWSRQHPTSSPTGAPYMAYFPALKKVIAWGDRYGIHSGDLWAWDGSNWTLLQAGPSVPPRESKGWTVDATMSPPDADTSIRKTVESVNPVLLPGWLPTDMDAHVMAGPSSFNVAYQSDQRDKRIILALVAANPPPAGEHGGGGPVKFRGVTAQYTIIDTTSPLSGRWLMWNEPGTMSEVPGIPYFLSTDGLTEQEFWQVANSLK